jgi:hypothetical protein
MENNKRGAEEELENPDVKRLCHKSMKERLLDVICEILALSQKMYFYTYKVNNLLSRFDDNNIFYQDINHYNGTELNQQIYYIRNQLNKIYEKL